MKAARHFGVLLALLLCAACPAFAQEDTLHWVTDSVLMVTETPQDTEQVHTTDSVLKKKHSPKVAIALSAVLPGTGQIYNKKWWKVPIIYAGFGASIYFVCHYSEKMVLYRNEYRDRMLERYDRLNPDYAKYSDENVLSMKQRYQRDLEIAAVATAAVYLLNIIDAAVDAHLFYFDVSEDLALQVMPYSQPAGRTQLGSTGLSFALKWR